MRELFYKHVGQTSPDPMIIDVERAAGIYIYDTDGKQYADLTSGICVSHLGHNHPVVQQAIADQSQRYLHTMVYGEHVQAPQVGLAYALTQDLDASLDCVYFTNSGSEATEGAIKLARRYTGRTRLLAARRGYHGSTIASMSLMSDPYLTLAYQPGIPGISWFDFNDPAALDLITEEVAAIIMEPVRGPAGVELPEPCWLRDVKERCMQTGTLLVFDEIQCGLGRIGHLWAHQAYEVVPDILLSAKALGGGLPIGALIAPRDILQAFTAKPMLGYISTFGGHPLCCAAGLAAYKHFKEHPDIITAASQKQSIIHSTLTSPHVTNIRSIGLMAAIDISDPSRLPDLVNTARKEGLLIDYFLFYKKGFRLAPPLIISEDELSMHLSVLNDIITDVLN